MVANHKYALALRPLFTTQIIHVLTFSIDSNPNS